MLSLPPRAPDLGHSVAKVAGGLKLKALCFAVAIAASVVPAGAGELSLAPRPVQVNEAEASRLYRAEWLGAHTRPGAREAASNDAFDNTLSALGANPAAIDGRLRAIVASVKDELRRAGIDSRKVRVRLRVRCTMKYVSVKRTMPALALAGQAAGTTKVVQTAVEEVCAIKLTLSPRSDQNVEENVEEKRTFSITLPSLQEVSQ
jgi:hypothetical protein